MPDSSQTEHSEGHGLRAALDLFAEICDLGADERDQRLDERCDGDNELRARVNALLREDDEQSGHVETGAGARLALDIAERQATAASLGTAPTLQGRYRILRIIGEGGMGTVYEAEQSSPRRLVALKSLRQGALNSEQMLRRFTLEAEVLARLQHPAIAQVYEAGFGDAVGEGPAWIAMELVRGKPIVSAARARGLSRDARLEIFLQICDAVFFAHQKGVIHRDLKPGNILLVDVENGTGSSLRLSEVKILDFGVARVVGDAWEDATALTGPGQLVGTLPYMSPEQVAGDPDAIDVRADVYALGVILYELLVGRRPFELSGRAAEEARRIVREEDPPLPSSIDPTLRGDLDAILLRALSKDVRRRYQSVARLADDIRAYLQGEPVAARSTSSWYMRVRWTRRHRVAIGTGLMIVLAIATFAVFASIDAQRKNRLAEDANSARAALEKELSETRLEQARLLSANGNVAGALAIVRSEREQRDDAHLRWVMREIAARHPCIDAFAPHAGIVRALALPNEGSLLLSAGEDGRAVLSTLRGEELNCADLGSAALSGAFDATDNRFVLGLADGRVVALDALTLEQRGELARHRAAVRSLTCLNGATASGAVDGTLMLIRADSSAQALEKQTRAIGAVAFVDDRTLAISEEGGSVMLMDLDEGTARLLARYDGISSSLTVDATRQRLLFGSSDRFVRAFDVVTGAPRESVEAGNGTIRALGIDEATGDVFVSGWWTMDRWDSSLVAKRRIAAPIDGPLCAIFATKYGLAVSGHVDGKVRLWALRTSPINGGGTEVARLSGRTTCTLSPDGALLAVGDGEGALMVCDARTGALRSLPPPHEKRVRGMSFDPGGTLVATAGDDGAVQVFEARTGVLFARVTGAEPQTAGSVTFSPDGRSLAAAFADRSMHIMAVSTLETLARLDTGPQQALSVVWSPDGTMLATCARDNVVRIWNRDGRELTSRTMRDTPWSLAFSPDGTLLACGMWSRVVELFDVPTLASAGRLTGPAGMIPTVAWMAPDEREGRPFVLASSADGALRVWDPFDHRLLFEFTPFVHADAVSCAIDRSGRIIAASGPSGEVATWDLSHWDEWAKRGGELP